MGGVGVSKKLSLILVAAWFLGCVSTVKQGNPSGSEADSVRLFVQEDPSYKRSSVSTAVVARPPQAQVRSFEDPFSAPDLMVEGLTVEPAVRVDSGGTSSAAEVSMASSGDDIVAAWIDLRAGEDLVRVGAAASTDGGVTWQDELLQPTGNPQSEDLHGDPITAYDPRTGLLWVGGFAVFDRFLFVSQHVPGTTSFMAPVTFGQGIIVDKPWMAAGAPPGMDATRLYAIDNAGLLFVSDNLGATWTASGSPDSQLGALPRVGPGGELYVASRQFEGCQLERSLDGGQTFDAPQTIGTFTPLFLGEAIPGTFRAPAFCILAVDPVVGNQYLAVAAEVEAEGDQQRNVDILLSTSIDQGDTWSEPRVIHGDSDPPGDQFMPWLEVDSTGRLHLVYLDTRRTVQDDTAPAALLDVYYGTSRDQGQTWTEVRLTPQAFDTSTAQWFNGIDQFVGDYLGLTVSGNRVVVGYGATFNGDLDIYAQRILLDDGILFADGFEGGDTAAWSVTIP